MIRIPFLACLAVAILVWPHASAADDAQVIQNDDRIVFVGDSITAQGALGGAGAWVALIGEGLRLARPTAKPVLIGLGGSGSTVGHWQHVEKSSRSTPTTLDDKTVDVGKTLDGKVDIVVVMLGMNDVLSPGMDGSASDCDAWLARYVGLIAALRERSKPRVVALATVTPCTEDPASPKNMVLTELNRRLATLAKQQGFRLLPTGAASFELLSLGRAGQPDFHVTGDFVHPNGTGHLAIAVGMLRGLGEADAAAKLLAKHAELYRPAVERLPTLSYILTRNAGSPDDAAQRFTIGYQWTTATATATATPPLVTPALPPGWTAEPATLSAAKGSFTVSGPLDRARTTITLNATSGGVTRTQAVTIPAGWRIATGRGQTRGWVQNSTYNPAEDRQPEDDALARGEGLMTPLAFAQGGPAPWLLHVASNDYTGGDRTGSVDLAAVTFFTHGRQARGARWIHSDRERTVDLQLGSQGFAGTWSLGVWLDGKTAYAGKLSAEPGGKATITATLRQGWNLLVFKSTFIQWQWQFSIELAGRDGDHLADLRYATRPPAAGR